MNDEIKGIIDRLERTDHKEYIAFEFADSATFDEMARCFEERKKLADYITNLQEENKRLKEIVENLTTMTVCGDRKQIKNTAQYKLDICKSRIDKAIEYVNTHKPSDTISFPLMKKDEENQVKSCFDYEFREIYQKELLEILQGSDKDE